MSVCAKVRVGPDGLVRLAAGRAQIWVIRAGLPVTDCARRHIGSGVAGAVRERLRSGL